MFSKDERIRFDRRTGWAAGLLLGCGLLAAQAESGDPVAPVIPLPAPGVPVIEEALPGEPGEEREYWEDTVDRALEKAASDNPDIRRSAVMLLGKYPVARAEQAVIAALEDPDAGVRQAALVSLFERRRLYRGETAVKIARRVGDPDVGIRRIASNVLPMVMHGFPLRMTPERRRPVRDLPEELQSVLIAAFRDEDTTVRRNMISHFSQLQVGIPEDLMAELLRDSDREVAVEAIDVAVRHFGADLLAGEAADLADHPDRIFRLTLARQLAGAGHPGAASALDRLREDPDDEVALEAEVAFFRQRADPESYAELLEHFDRTGGHIDIARRAIRAVTLLDANAGPFLRQWLKHPDPGLREEALRIYFARFPGEVGEGELVGLLEEENRPLRDAALRFLRRHSIHVSGRILEAAAESRYTEVRRAAVEFTRFVPPGIGEAVLEELLLDEDTGVRAAVLGEVASRRMDGWVRILELSLRDNDAAIRNAAFRGLADEVTPGTLAALAAFLQREPESSLRPAIEEHLARYGEDPAPVPETDSGL